MFSCFVAAIQSFAEIGFNFSSPSHVIGKKNMTPEGYKKLLEVICQKITFATYFHLVQGEVTIQIQNHTF